MQICKIYLHIFALLNICTQTNIMKTAVVFSDSIVKLCLQHLPEKSVSVDHSQQ